VGDDMSDKNKEQESVDSVTDNQTGVDKSKRKFSKAGMAAPVIMTLANRPAWGASGRSMCAISGFDSLGALDPADISGVPVALNENCGTHLSPGHWQGSGWKHEWPTGYMAANLISDGEFAGQYEVYSGGHQGPKRETYTYPMLPSGSIYFVKEVFTESSSSATLFDEVNQITSTDQYLRHMIGLFLAAKEGGLTVLTAAQIVSIYNGTFSGGSVEVMPGVNWNQAQMSYYINYLMAHHDLDDGDLSAGISL